MQIEITDNSQEFIKAMQAAALRALEKCGLTAEGYAKKLCPVDTGNLRNSITHQVEDREPAGALSPFWRAAFCFIWRRKHLPSPHCRYGRPGGGVEKPNMNQSSVPSPEPVEEKAACRLSGQGLLENRGSKGFLSQKWYASRKKTVNLPGG